MSKCNLCGADGASIQDRNYPSGRKKICKDCHEKRLLNDFKLIKDLHEINKRPRGLSET